MEEATFNNNIKSNLLWQESISSPSFIVLQREVTEAQRRDTIQSVREPLSGCDHVKFKWWYVSWMSDG